VLAGGVSDLRN